jgi:ribosome-binding factor A
MPKQRTDRLNSLLKEVISEVIHREVRNPHLNEFVSITRVDITKDLHHAKVYVSIIGTDAQKSESMMALNSAAGFIAVNSSKKVVMHYFPELKFILDDSVDKHMRIQKLLTDLSVEREMRNNEEDGETAPPES